MAFNFKDSKQRQKIFIILFVIMILVIGFIWWFWFFREEEPVSSSAVPKVLLKEININFKLLEEPAFKELQPFREIIPLSVPAGKANPFLLYQ